MHETSSILNLSYRYHYVGASSDLHADCQNPATIPHMCLADMSTDLKDRDPGWLLETIGNCLRMIIKSTVMVISFWHLTSRELVKSAKRMTMPWPRQIYRQIAKCTGQCATQVFGYMVPCFSVMLTVWQTTRSFRSQVMM